MPPQLQRLPFAWVLIVLFTIWILYLLYKIAQHVNAWPF